MQSVEIPLYQSGKRSATAFQIGAAQDQQTKSAEPVRWRISASKVTVRTVWIVRTEVVSSHCNIYHLHKDTVNQLYYKLPAYYV